MNKLSITSESRETFTTVSNLFIDTYMAAAPGDYVKVYLYLLRLMQTEKEGDLSEIADFFDITEKDLCRALRYWIKQDVLRLVYEGKTLVGITLLPLKNSEPEEMADDPFASMAKFQSEQDAKKRSRASTKRTTKATMAEPEDMTALDNVVPMSATTRLTEDMEVSGRLLEQQAASAVDTEESVVPTKKELTTAQLVALQRNDDFSQLVYLIETYFGKAMTQADCRSLAYIFDDLHFSTELLEYLIEFSVTNNKKSLRYMEKVAIDWYQQGITDVETAKELFAGYPTLYKSVLKALSIRRQTATAIEKNYMDTWYRTYGFDEGIILEACNRAMISKPGSANFPYVNGILESWHKNNVRTLSDIEALDKDFYNNKTKPVRAMQTANQKATVSAKSDEMLDELSRLFMEDVNSGVS